MKRVQILIFFCGLYFAVLGPNTEIYLCKCPYLFQIQKKRTSKNCEFWHFLLCESRRFYAKKRFEKNYIYAKYVKYLAMLNTGQLHTKIYLKRLQLRRRLFQLFCSFILLLRPLRFIYLFTFSFVASVPGHYYYYYCYYHHYY